MTLTEFLLARAAGDRDDAQRARQTDGAYGYAGELIEALESRAEVAVRVVVEHPAGGHYVYNDQPPGTRACETCGDVVTVAWPCRTMRLIALPYTDHPDFNPDWRL